MSSFVWVICTVRNSSHLLCKFSKVARNLNHIRDFRHWIVRRVSVLSLFRSGVTFCPNERKFLSNEVDVEWFPWKSKVILCKLKIVFLFLQHRLRTSSVASLTALWTSYRQLWHLCENIGCFPWVRRAQMFQGTRSCVLRCGEDSNCWLSKVTRHLR